MSLQTESCSGGWQRISVQNRSCTFGLGSSHGSLKSLHPSIRICVVLRLNIVVRRCRQRQILHAAIKNSVGETFDAERVTCLQCSL